MIDIIQHRVHGAPYVPTSKKGGKVTPEAIVLHFTAGWLASGAVDTLARSDRQASAHGVLARDGTWTQIVPFNEKAWHAGPSFLKGVKIENKSVNVSTIGIEIDNIGYLECIARGESYKDEYGNAVRQSGRDGDRHILVSGKRRVNGELKDWPHYVHPRIGSKVLAWEPYYEPQLKFLDELIRALLKTYPSIKIITTHEVIDTRGWKTDVAPHFPFSRYASLGAEMVLAPHAKPLPRPVVLPKATQPKTPINLPVIGSAPTYVPNIEKPKDTVTTPVIGSAPTKPQAPEEKLIAATPAPVVPDEREEKPWLTFFGKKIAFEDAWFDNKDSDIA